MNTKAEARVWIEASPDPALEEESRFHVALEAEAPIIKVLSCNLQTQASSGQQRT